jgi:hypothetical protein
LDSSRVYTLHKQHDIPKQQSTLPYYSYTTRLTDTRAGIILKNENVKNSILSLKKYTGYAFKSQK